MPYVSFGDAPYVLYQYEVLTVQEPLIPGPIYLELDRFVRALPYDPKPPLSTTIGVTSSLNVVRRIQIPALWAFVQWIIIDPKAVVLDRVQWLPLMN